MRGIGLLSGAGVVAVRGEERHRRHPAVAVSYGSGLALIADEFALLLNLRDVYWAKQGRIPIDVGVGGIALTGSYLAALPVLRGLQREKRRAPEPVPAAGTPPAPQPAPEPEAGRRAPPRSSSEDSAQSAACGTGETNASHTVAGRSAWQRP